ncbi:MAG: DUF992 domain-containing protein [Xanthobacteraceae bacterium]|nr:DUF992 domain-containing protein [Xanthobacteraceae bacterium]
MRTIRNLLFVLGAAVCAAATPAQAEPFHVGSLLCSGSPRVGVLIGSTQTLRCVFHSRRSPRRYFYEGRVTRIGLDLGVTGNSVLSWAVFARNSRVRHGTLRGSYVGGSANIALGPGRGANVLIGGSRRSISLQPISLERSIGINLAATVTHLTLGRRGTPPGDTVQTGQED